MKISNNVDIEIHKKYWSCGTIENYTVIKTVTDDNGEELDNDYNTFGFELNYSSLSVIADSDYEQLESEGYSIPDNFQKYSELNSEFKSEFIDNLHEALDELRIVISKKDFDRLVYNNEPLPLCNYINSISLEYCKDWFAKK